MDQLEHVEFYGTNAAAIAAEEAALAAEEAAAAEEAVRERALRGAGEHQALCDRVTALEKELELLLH